MFITLHIVVSFVPIYVLLSIMWHYCLLPLLLCYLCPRYVVLPYHDRGPPCASFTFTAVDDCRAVFFAGRQPSGRVNDAFILDHRLMVRHKNISVAFNLSSIAVRRLA